MQIIRPLMDGLSRVEALESVILQALQVIILGTGPLGVPQSFHLTPRDLSGLMTDLVYMLEASASRRIPLGQMMS